MHLDHLDIEALVDLQFGEVAGDRARRMKQHLAGCALCRQEFDRLHRSMEGTEACRGAEEFDSRALLSKIRTWETGRARAGRYGEALKRRIAVELAPYVGQAGADTLLGPAQDDGRDLLSSVAPFLAMFLGRRAAGNLVTRVVEKTIVGMNALCES